MFTGDIISGMKMFARKYLVIAKLLFLLRNSMIMYNELFYDV